MKKRYLALGLLAIATIGCAAYYTRVSVGSGWHKSGNKVVKTLATKEFTSIKADLDLADLDIKTGKEFKVSYEGHQHFTPTATVKNGQLTLSQPIHGNYRCSGTERVTIVVPEKLKRVYLRTDEGDINVEKLLTAAGEVHSSEGDVTLRNLTTEKQLKIATDEGDVNLHGLNLQNGLHVYSDEGDVNIINTAAGGYDLATDEGDITVHGHDVSGDDASHYLKNTKSKNVIKVNTDEGDITVD
jgi:hypothetical protein